MGVEGVSEEGMEKVGGTDEGSKVRSREVLGDDKDELRWECHEVFLRGGGEDWHVVVGGGDSVIY